MATFFAIGYYVDFVVSGFFSRALFQIKVVLETAI